MSLYSSINLVGVDIIMTHLEEVRLGVFVIKVLRTLRLLLLAGLGLLLLLLFALLLPALLDRLSSRRDRGAVLPGRQVQVPRHRVLYHRGGAWRAVGGVSRGTVRRRLHPRGRAAGEGDRAATVCEGTSARQPLGNGCVLGQAAQAADPHAGVRALARVAQACRQSGGGDCLPQRGDKGFVVFSRADGGQNNDAADGSS